MTGARTESWPALRDGGEYSAASLAEHLKETLTIHRLHVFPELGVSLKTTNLIDSVMARLESKTNHVTRWRTSNLKLRWCAAVLRKTERQFRRLKHHRLLFNDDWDTLTPTAKLQETLWPSF